MPRYKAHFNRGLRIGLHHLGLLKVRRDLGTWVFFFACLQPKNNHHGRNQTRILVLSSNMLYSLIRPSKWLPIVNTAVWMNHAYGYECTYVRQSRVVCIEVCRYCLSCDVLHVHAYINVQLCCTCVSRFFLKSSHLSLHLFVRMHADEDSKHRCKKRPLLVNVA